MYDTLYVNEIFCYIHNNKDICIKVSESVTQNPIENTFKSTKHLLMCLPSL